MPLTEIRWRVDKEQEVLDPKEGLTSVGFGKFVPLVLVPHAIQMNVGWKDWNLVML